MKYFIITNTISNKNYKDILSKIILKKKLVACVKYNKVNNLYWFDENFKRNDEILLTNITKKKNLNKITNEIKKNSNQKLPKIIKIPVNGCNIEYMRCISNVIK